MAKKTQLKVYRTPIGFHDAYVAAPNQRAALEAWGTTHNLFARGVAEIVDDPELTAEPLAQPGVVIKRSRGTTAEQIASLPDVQRPASTDDPTAKAAALKKQPPPRPKPKPSRKPVEDAENALAELQDAHEEARRGLEAEQAKLDRRKADLEKAQRTKLADAERTVADAERTYSAALREWRG